MAPLEEKLITRTLVLILNATCYVGFVSNQDKSHLVVCALYQLIKLLKPVIKVGELL